MIPTDWIGPFLETIDLPPLRGSQTVRKQSRLADWGEWGLFAIKSLFALLFVSLLLWNWYFGPG